MVAVKAADAETVLAAPPPGVRLFLLYGPDAGANTERARRLETLALKRGGGDAPIRIGSDELSDHPGRIVDEARAISLFGGEPVIALRVLDGRHNVIGAVEPLIAEPPAGSWLIIEAGDLNPSSPLRKAFEGSKQALAVPAFPLEGSQLAAFLRAAAAEAGVTLDPAAAELLAESVGSDRLAIRAEIGKLALHAGDGGVVSAASVEALVADAAGGQTDAVIDAALAGDTEALEAGLARLRADAGSAAALGALTLRHLMQMQNLRASVEGGGSLARVLDSVRPARRRAAAEAVLSRWSAPALRNARNIVDRAVAQTRRRPALDNAILSEALHRIALEARRLKRFRS